MSDIEPTQLAEGSDVSSGWAQVIGWGFAGLLIIIALFLWWAFGDSMKDWMAKEPRFSLEAFPKPRLSTDPARDLRDVQARDEIEISTYAWTDTSRRTARIPINRAVSIAAKKRLITIRISTEEDRHVQ